MNRPLVIIAIIFLLTLVFVVFRISSDDGYQSAVPDRTLDGAVKSARGEVRPAIAETTKLQHVGKDNDRLEQSATNDDLRADRPVDDRRFAVPESSAQTTSTVGAYDSRSVGSVDVVPLDSSVIANRGALGSSPEAPSRGVRHSINPEPGENEPQVLGPGPGQSEPQDFGPGPGENEPQVFGPGPGENEPQVFGPGPGENEPQVFGPGPGENEPQVFGPGPGEDDSTTDDSTP